jgi:hypothetical protein
VVEAGWIDRTIDVGIVTHSDFRKIFEGVLTPPNYALIMGGMNTPTQTTITLHPKRALGNAWGDLIARYPWEWFANFTFIEDLHPEAALKKFKVWVSMLNRRLYGPRWAKKSHGGVYWVLAVEYQKRSVIHFHVLPIGIGTQDQFHWMKRWENLDRKTGFARIYPVENIEKVSRYLCKYVPKGGEVYFSDNLKDISQDLFGSHGQT